MGGSAFSSGPHSLVTPRMPPEVYNLVRSWCHDRLSGLFGVVASPVEGPEKEDFGDIDFLVAEPLGKPAGGSGEQGQDGQPRRKSARAGGGDRDIWREIIAVFGAKHSIRCRDSSNLALPWPADIPVPRQQRGGDGLTETTTTSTSTNTSTSSTNTTTTESANKEQRFFIQVDVRICPTTAILRWAAFKHAHGDLWNMLGSVIRPLGLTVDEEAMYLRVPEIEREDRTRARVFLTADPGEAKAFLGLPDGDGQWDRPFGSYEDVFRYAALCRFFFLAPPPPPPEEGREYEQAGVATTTTDDGTGTGIGKVGDKRRLSRRSGPPSGGYNGLHAAAGLTANDRRRMRTRPLFRAWIDGFVPRCLAAGLYPRPAVAPRIVAADADAGEPAPHAAPAPTQEEMRGLVRDLAFERWPASREGYASRLAEWTKARQRLDLVNGSIKGSIPLEEVAALLALPAPAPAPADAEAAQVVAGHRGVVISALKRIILEGDESFGGIVPPVPLRTEDGYWLAGEAAEFVRGRWREVAPLAWEAHREKLASKLKWKAEEAGAGVTRGEGGGGGGVPGAVPGPLDDTGTAVRA